MVTVFDLFRQDLNPQAQNAVKKKKVADLNAQAQNAVKNQLGPDLNAQALNALRQTQGNASPIFDNISGITGANAQVVHNGAGMGLNPQALNAVRNQGAGLDSLGRPIPGQAVGSGSGSSFAGGIPLVPNEPAPIVNPYESIYDKLMQTVQGIGQQGLAAFDPIRQSIQENYANSSKQLYEPYQNSREGLDKMASNLGVSGNDIYKGYDSSLRQIQENTDQAQAQDLSYLDKMKALKSSTLDSLYMNLSNEKAMQMANWQIMLAERQQALDAAAKGGGGRSGGGGRGGSGSSGQTNTEKATETDTLPGFYSQDLMNYLLATDPQAAALYGQSANTTSDNPIIKDLQTQYNFNAAKPISSTRPLVLPQANAAGRLPLQIAGTFNKVPLSNYPSTNVVATKAKAATLKKIQDLIGMVSSTGGGLGNPTSRQVITTTGSKKIKAS